MIRIIRICDRADCQSKHEQIINHGLKQVTYEVAFICSDCLLKEARQADSQSTRDLVALRREESAARYQGQIHPFLGIPGIDFSE